MTLEGAADWFGRNAQRIRLLAGVFCFVSVVNALAHGSGWILWTESVLVGVLGGWCLGGWPAFRRLARSPRFQLRHWYAILIDARRLHHYHQADGSVEVVRMRPVLHCGGIIWEQEPRFHQGDRVDINEVSEA